MDKKQRSGTDPASTHDPTSVHPDIGSGLPIKDPLTDSDLKNRFLRAIFRFKRHEMTLPPDSGIHMSEFILMMRLSGNCPGSAKNINVSELKDNLFISKSAVSQILNSLESKGFLQRTIDKDDRRKISVVLTPAGQSVLIRMKEYFDQMLEETILRFGEEDAATLVLLFNRLIDITEEIKQEQHAAQKIGDDAF